MTPPGIYFLVLFFPCLFFSHCHGYMLQVKLTKDKVLVISGKHVVNNEVTESGNVHTERTAQSFTRRYQLPDSTETEAISAKLQDGLLTLTVPKTHMPEAGDQEILIQEAAHNIAAESASDQAAAAADPNPKPKPCRGF